MTELIRLEVRAPVAELVLNRPEKRNALSQEMWAAIPGLIAECEANPDVKVLILHGGEAGQFAAGADISEFETIYATREAALEAGKTISAALQAVEGCKKPVIAAIEGACVGGGMSLALACDIRLAASGAKFGITPAKLGLVYPPTDTRLLLNAVGPGRAKRLLFTGKIFDAASAHEMGLVDEIVSGLALDAAQDLAREISGVSQWSVRAIKTMIAGIGAGWTDTSDEAIELFLDGFENADHREGYRAFLKKRKPDFPIR
ncbi:MAG: enoyl-CoA hydratase-related protein [Hyphomonadaceae bacterium]|nr:enoyl-CoA hydratase-related protein [Hyphomonadaceae bacterium]